ncbi:glycerophosphodiester phosphodiesterase family protein [Amnibacterium endophyticum]|uniref:Glycerophosphodiester phosphodiesterase family protein n=1 Tax=Amnibacterium endophyticum TaxID=2109337 RepID=A0ABW4LIG4_9MICO
MSGAGWFVGPLPRIIAHRGLALEAPENSVEAFRAALAAGATHLETDVRATADGHAVLAHDPRLAGREVASTSLADLRAAHPALCTLGEALAACPDAPFNVDVKHPAAAGPAARAVLAAHATSRVLIASFSRRRRLAALRALPGAPTSVSAASVALIVLGVRLRLPALLALAVRGVQAVQVPEQALRTDLMTPWTIAELRRSGAELHVWVVNDPVRMRQLVARGVDGIVTDRADLARDALR